MTGSHTFLDAWLQAAANKDVEKLVHLMTEDAVLVSPVSFKNVSSRSSIEPIFRAIFKVLPDLRYDRSESFQGGSALVFSGTLSGGVTLEGIDLFTLNDFGQASELKVFVRPLKAANLFAAEMQKALS